MPTSAVGIAYAQGSAGASVADGPTLISPARGYAEISTPVSSPSSPAINTIRDTLIKAGWTWTGDTKASGTIFAPFGWGFLSFQRLVATIGDGLHGTAYEYYDPRYEAAPHGWLGGIIGGYAIQGVSVGDSDESAQLNLIIAINFTQPVLATAQDTHTILLTANALGTKGNGVVIGGNGSISIGTDTTGGGWILQSRSQGEVERFGNTGTVQLSVHTGAAGNGNVQIDVSGGASFSFPFGSYNWRMMADTYQVLFENTGSAGGEDIYAANSFLWISMPVADPRDGNPRFTTAIFIATGSGFTASLGAGNAGNDVYCWVDGTFTHGGQATAWGMVAYHSESGMVTDLTDQPFLQAPLVALACPSGYRFVGYIPDAYLNSQPGLVGSQAARNGRYYRCIASQAAGSNRPPGSLWLMTDEKMAATPAGGGTPPPNNAVGTGDVTTDSGYGKLTRTNGDQFTLSMASGSALVKALTITGIPAGVPVANGSTYQIVAVDTVAQTLLFAPSILPVSGVHWEIAL